MSCTSGASVSLLQFHHYHSASILIEKKFFLSATHAGYNIDKSNNYMKSSRNAIIYVNEQLFKLIDVVISFVETFPLSKNCLIL